MLKKLTLTTALCAFSITASANADHSANGGVTADDHAPIGVMGDHYHKVGEVMLSYRFSKMGMKGSIDGDSKISPSEVTSAGGNYGYMMTPTEMDMNMHMFGAMYAPSNDLTLMVMGHYMENKMNMVNRAGITSQMKSSGLGDTTISALYKLSGNDCDCGTVTRLHANIGLSLPTGSTDEKGFRMGAYGNLPYAMQLGSGTFDPVLGLTYASNSIGYSWGAQAKGTFRLEDNGEGYNLGNEYKATTWLAKNLGKNLSTSLRLELTHKDEIDGQDNSTIGMRNMVYTFDPDNYGGQYVDVGFGVNYLHTEGVLKGQRLAVEFSRNVYQDSNGPQMRRGNTFWAGWQYAF